MTVAISREVQERSLDRRAFEQMLLDRLPELRRLARRLAGDSAEAKDLVQETCRRAIEARAQFRDGTNALAWLCRILLNLFRDNRRRAQREVHMGSSVVEAPAHEPIALWRWITDEDLRSAVASLRDPYRATFHRYAIDGQPYLQIAGDLGTAPGTVGARLLRARTKVRGFLTRRLAAPEADPDRATAMKRRRREGSRNAVGPAV